jgi:HEAT repeat protein
LQLARALLGAARNWVLYPAEHPAVGQSMDRLADAVRLASQGGMISIGVTPETLLVEGAPANAGQPAIADAAALLHDRDFLQLTVIGDVPRDALRTLLEILSLEAEVRRARGGPAQIWAREGHPSLVIAQIDYRQVLEGEQGDTPEPARRDDVWRSIVLSMSSGQNVTFDERAHQRLLAIAGSPADIGDLAAAVMAPKCTVDGSPLITSQAAAVLAAFRHLSSIVFVTAPERMPEVMSNLAAAASVLDPQVVMQVLRSEDDPADQIRVVHGMTAAFDDLKVAQLLATALAVEGQASDRLATIFNTIAPDEQRKERVLTLTRSLLSETDFGRAAHFQALWTSVQELLVSYNEKPFVPNEYRTTLDRVGGFAERMAVAELPPELTEWLKTLDQENVRTMSVRLLTDLLSIERDETRAADLVLDMEALAEDLLMSGAWADARAVIASLAERGQDPDAAGRDASRQALDRLGESIAMRETAALVGDVDDEAWTAIREVLTLVGPPCIEALKPNLLVEHDTRAAQRSAEVVASFGVAAVPRLGSLAGHSSWYVQRTATRLLGRIAAPEGVPLLQALLRNSDPRVAREAVAALSSINDPSAARAIHVALRTAAGELRRAIVDALVADRDPRVIPMLLRILDESQPLGKDHEVVLETLTALGIVGTDQAVPILAVLIQRTALLRRRKLRALKERGISALARIGTTKATHVIEEAARTGDRMLRKVISARHRVHG